MPLKFFLLFTFALHTFAGALPAQTAAAPVSLYADALASGWEDWSWGEQSHNFNQSSPTHTGGASLRVRFTGGWSGVQIGANTNLPSTAQTPVLEMWLYGTSTGQIVRIAAGNDCASVSQDVTLTPNVWTRVQLSLAGLGRPAPVKWVYWFNPTNNAQPEFFVDDVSLIDLTLFNDAEAGPLLTVNASELGKAISPLIYGMNFPDADLAEELRLPVQRWGGNSTTRYNWELDVSNRGSDWYFENIAEGSPGGRTTADAFIEDGLARGSQILLTVPLIGWTPKSDAPTCGFSVSKYGAQQSTDVWRPDCGNGLRSDGSAINGNDPLDTSKAITSAFVQGWMAHLRQRFGGAAEGGVHYYNLDNEPMLWNSTHRDVHPTPVSYEELLSRTIDYAAAIKAADPAARTLGPVLWGWTAYFYSALDAKPGGSWWNNPQDRLAHGNLPLVTWYLRQLKAYEAAHGLRLLDYLDLHFYPQGEGVFSAEAGDPATQALRLRSTRALWDPTYTDESWIAEPVRLIPRMRDWVDENYPGTQLAMSEYSWGAMCHISGALAQADVLGIFGREGMDLATLWGPPAANEPGAFAFRMFLNANGAGAHFGEVSLAAQSADADRLAIYAARRGDGALTLIIINKTASALTSDLLFTGFTPGAGAQMYQYAASHQDTIAALPGPAASAEGFSMEYPAYSITLVTLPDSRDWKQVYLPVVRR